LSSVAAIAATAAKVLLFFALLLSFRVLSDYINCDIHVFVSFASRTIFTIHSVASEKKKRGKTSHPIEIIPETAGEIKVNCYCYTPPALLEGKIRVSRHFTTTLFFIILNVLYK
jgi:hypothetical protein